MNGNDASVPTASVHTTGDQNAWAGNDLRYTSVPRLWLDVVYAQATFESAVRTIDEILSAIEQDSAARQSTLYASRIRGISALKEVCVQAVSVEKWFFGMKSEMFAEPTLAGLFTEILGQITVIETEFLDRIDMERLKTDPGYPGSFAEIAFLVMARLKEMHHLCTVLGSFIPLYERFKVVKLTPEQLLRSSTSQ